MSLMGYRILDALFLVFHSTLIIFNLFGWVLKRTRIWNLILLVLTGTSWLFLGLIVGTIGYCPLTEWHFNVLEKLGKTGLPASYIKYLADRITGFNFSPELVDKITLMAFIAAMALSLTLNIRDHVRKR